MKDHHDKIKEEKLSLIYFYASQRKRVDYDTSKDRVATFAEKKSMLEWLETLFDITKATVDTSPDGYTDLNDHPTVLAAVVKEMDESFDNLFEECESQVHESADVVSKPLNMDVSMRVMSQCQNTMSKYLVTRALLQWYLDRFQNLVKLKFYFNRFPQLKRW